MKKGEKKGELELCFSRFERDLFTLKLEKVFQCLAMEELGLGD